MSQLGIQPTPESSPRDSGVVATNNQDDRQRLEAGESGVNVPAQERLRKNQNASNSGRAGRRNVIVVMIALSIIALAYSAKVILARATQQQATSADDDVAVPRIESPPLSVATVRVGSVKGPDLSHFYAGLLVAQRESPLSFERAGRLTQINVQEGSVVRQGDLLAELDQDDLDAASERVSSELAAAQALLDEFIAGPRKQLVDAARAKVNELQAQVDLARVSADRQKGLAPRGATSGAQLDAAVLGLKASQFGFEAAKAVLEELNEGTRAEQIAAQRAKCGAIRASLREIDVQRRDSIIVAPFDGIVGARMIDEGVVLSAGTAVLNLISNELEVQVGLPPEAASGLVPGDEVVVQLRDCRRPAWIDRTEPAIRRDTRTRVVYARFRRQPDSQADAKLFASLSGEGWVAGEVIDLRLQRPDKDALTSAFWLPNTALVRGARGLFTVLVVPGRSRTEAEQLADTSHETSAVCERRAVELLKTDGSLSLVQGMLEINEQVISDGLHRVTAGMRVYPVLSPSKSSAETATETMVLSQ